jgi:hypothetical protein
LLIRIDCVRLDELVAEDGRDAGDQAAYLLTAIAENREEAERRNTLRRAAQAGDVQAIMQGLTCSSSPLTTEQVIETLGQQMNFQAKVTFPPSRLQFEDLEK